MLKLNITYEIVTAESAEHGEADEHGFIEQDTEYTFREVVELLRYGQPSCSPASGAPYEWITHYGEQDYRSGDYENRSVHFSNENNPRKAKYWRKAMQAARII
jgi:hypothetical protein